MPHQTSPEGRLKEAGFLNYLIDLYSINRAYRF
jgi:hypothetical protein